MRPRADAAIKSTLDKPKLLSPAGYLEPIKPWKLEATDFSDVRKNLPTLLGVSGVIGGVASSSRTKHVLLREPIMFSFVCDMQSVTLK